MLLALSRMPFQQARTAFAYPVPRYRCGGHEGRFGLSGRPVLIGIIDNVMLQRAHDLTHAG